MVRAGVFDPEAMGNCTENRFDLAGCEDVEAIESDLPWLWKLVRPDEAAESAGLVGEAACSAVLVTIPFRASIGPARLRSLDINT